MSGPAEPLSTGPRLYRDRPISLVVIDDNPTARDGVAAQIRAQPGFHVLVARAEVEEAVRQVRTTRPDVVLLNVHRTGDDTLTLAGALHGEAPESRVIVMGLAPFDEDVAGYIRAGVAGFTMIYATFDTVLAAIHAVADGTHVLPTELTRPLFVQLKTHAAHGHPKRILDVKRLTKRERAVTDLIVQGLSNKEIAEQLQIALDTVKGHVHNLLAKLAVNSRLEVAAFSRNSTSPASDQPTKPTKATRALKVTPGAEDPAA